MYVRQPRNGQPQQLRGLSYSPTGGTLLGVTSRALQCPGGPANPPQVPSVINGNILFGPSTGTYGAVGGKHRGFLFFQKRTAAANPSWGGGAGNFCSRGSCIFTSVGSDLWNKHHLSDHERRFGSRGIYAGQPCCRQRINDGQFKSKHDHEPRSVIRPLSTPSPTVMRQTRHRHWCAYI